MTWTGPMVRAAVLGGLIVAATAGGVAAQDAPAGKGWIGRFDADKDGAVAGAELAAVTDRRFRRLDQDQDGFLSRQELPDRGGAGAAREAADDDDQDQEAPTSTAEVPGSGSAATKGRPRKGRLDRLDRDDDGRLSREEFAATNQALMRRLDKNGDGRVTPEEAPQQQRPEQG